MENVWIFHLVCQHTTRARRGGESRKKRQREVPNAMPHVATCSGSSSGNSNAHVNVNLVNATKHSTATAATTTNETIPLGIVVATCPRPFASRLRRGLPHPLGLPDFTCASMSTFTKLVGNMTSCQRCHPAAQTRPLADVGNQGIQRPSHAAAAVATWGMVTSRVGKGGRQLCLMRSWHLAKVVFAVAARG